VGLSAPTFGAIDGTVCGNRGAAMCLGKRNPDVGENPRVYSGSIKPGGLILVHDVTIAASRKKKQHSRGSIMQRGAFYGLRRAYDEFLAAKNWKSEVLPGAWGLGVIYKPC
jgi:hypothetical protein